MMQPIYRKWSCYNIVSNGQYIAALGSGVTILNRSSHEFIHHFTGIRYIHGGIFLNEDVLVVFTGEQRLYFLQISEKKVLWECPRPRQLASSGDIKCAQIPGTAKIACIARGRKDLNEHFYVIVDYMQQTVILHGIPACYRVVYALVWTQSVGLSFLSSQAKGDGNLLYRIIGIDEDGVFSTLWEWEDVQRVNAYTGNYLLLSNYRNQNLELNVYTLVKTALPQKLEWEKLLQIPLPTFRGKGPVGSNNVEAPRITWIDESAGLLTACTPGWIGVYSFLKGNCVVEYGHSNIACGTIIDRKLFVGCTPGLWVDGLTSFTGRIT